MIASLGAVRSFQRPQAPSPGLLRFLRNALQPRSSADNSVLLLTGNGQDKSSLRRGFTSSASGRSMSRQHARPRTIHHHTADSRCLAAASQHDLYSKSAVLVQTAAFSSSRLAASWWPWRKHRSVRSSCDPLQVDDLPVPTLADDTTYPRILNPTNDLKIRCTEFDESGNVTIVNGEYKKTELIAKVSYLVCGSGYASALSSV